MLLLFDILTFFKPLDPDSRSRRPLNPDPDPKHCQNQHDIFVAKYFSRPKSSSEMRTRILEKLYDYAGYATLVLVLVQI